MSSQLSPWSSLITPTIVLITSHFSNSAKFRRNVKIPRQRANSVARLEIPQPAENWALLMMVLVIEILKLLVADLHALCGICRCSPVKYVSALIHCET